MKKYMLSYIIILLFFFHVTRAQENNILHGRVIEHSEGEEKPVIGANVYWLGTTEGTVTGNDGKFKIQNSGESNRLVISYVGYQTDTIKVANNNHIEVHLHSTLDLDEVEVAHRVKTSEISYLNPLKTEKIGEDELLKAACCNLSESFETNPSVDVTFTDAVTGTRQIQMLGLAGPYTQITSENMPGVHGLSTIYGLTFIPGTWIEGIQLNKGTGSVINGYESIAGQINVELRKPENAERLYLNLYGNEGGRIEGNANIAHRFDNERWSTGVLLHAANNAIKWDRNNDGFLDKPLSKRLIGINRWKYIGPNGLRFQFGLKSTYSHSDGGQDMDIMDDAENDSLWKLNLDLQQVEGWAKIGKVWVHKPWKSMALQVSARNHQQDSYFGMKQYFATQQSIYANFIYQSMIGTNDHKFRTGTSFQYDNYNEELNHGDYSRVSTVPGVFFEYSYSLSHKFSMVAGGRADYHNLYDRIFAVPRLHLRYEIIESLVFRASGGLGHRTANIFAENNGLLASSRTFIIMGEESDKPYGLEPEKAWNYGANLTKHFEWAGRRGILSFDFYRTDFENQIVVDLDKDPRLALFYNLNGESFSNSFQGQLDYELIPSLDARLAYRWYDVQTTYHGELLQKPLLSNHRAFLNLGYSTNNGWKFDYTINWKGGKRIPSTSDNPPAYRLPEHSPDFFLMNAQVSKKWNNGFEVYAGMENITNYIQDNPIIASGDPFGDYFDSSLIWGPIFGRNTYFGIRYRIK